MSVDALMAAAVLREADCLYDRPEVEAAFDRIAARINEDLAKDDPLVVCVMTGGVVAAGHLLPRLAFPLQLDYIHATRYRGKTSGGGIHWLVEPRHELRGRNILLIDDILDEGYTLAAILDYCRAHGAASVRTAVLVSKQHARKHPGAAAEYVGLEVPDRYVFGYGMDYHEYLRNAPGIYAVKDL
jgi:hypoxanthine phosphoribosyltransferase